MFSIAWQRRLDDAATKEEIVAIANDFLMQWSEEELAQLPDDCQPRPMENADQVNAYALKLAHRDTVVPGYASALHRMATFFTKAALRAFQIDEMIPDASHGKRHNGRAST